MTTPVRVQPALFIAHHHPGRLRMRADAFLGPSPTAEQTRLGLARIRGVRSVGHDPRSGSLLVEYDPRAIDIDTLKARIEELSHLPIVAKARPRPRGAVAGSVLRFAEQLDDAARSVTKGRFDLGAVVSTGLMAAGVYSFFKSDHPRLPRWDNLLYWAYSVFVHAHGQAHSAP